MACTIPLCDVRRATRPAPEEPLQVAVRELLGAAVEACGADVDRVVPVSQNAFLTAAWRAYAEHRPLVLSPDAVWLCIAQGFAAHVREHAEALRGRFVRHQGRETLRVFVDRYCKGAPDNPWPEIFAEFSAQLAGHIGRQRDLVVCDFSTTGPVERAASELVLMDAMQKYFRYELVVICGIPEITLTGTVEDWRSVRRRAQHLAEYDLEWWTSVLVPALDEFVAAAEGRPDVAFWRRFFADSSGGMCGEGPNVYGWILLLFPYLTGHRPDGALHRSDVVVAARGASPVAAGGGAAPWLTHARLDPSCVPLGLACAPLTVGELDGSSHELDLLGGFVGVAQDAATLAVRPAIGWAVRERAGAVLVHDEHGPIDAARALGAHDELQAEFKSRRRALISVDVERALCSRTSTPVGRLFLDHTGLYFVPGDDRDTGPGAWLGRAMVDDDEPSGPVVPLSVGRPDPGRLSAPGALALGPRSLADLAISTPDARTAELAVTLADGERVRFTIVDPPPTLAAWRDDLPRWR